MMGAYAPYILASYGLSAGVIAWMVVDSLLRARRWRNKAEGERR
jgi:heme exporter protein CcmD